MSYSKSIISTAIPALVAGLTFQAEAAIYNLSYQFDLTQGSQFEIGGTGSGTSIFRTALDNTQSFTLQDGDTVNFSITFLGGQYLTVNNNAGSISSGSESIGLEIPLPGLGVNSVTTTVDITQYGGSLLNTSLTNPLGSAVDQLAPRASGNLTDSTFDLQALSISMTILSGLTSPQTFNQARLTVTAGSPLVVNASPVPVPGAVWLFISGLGVLTRLKVVYSPMTN